jgi:glycosyltransferase involved in cell wall biosynthesis
VRIALVTTPPSVRSGIGDYTRHLVPYLLRSAEIEVFVADELAGEQLPDDLGGGVARGISTLARRDFDQILYQLGNEANHAFMARALPRLGGVVCQHDWVLFDLALAAWPAIARGGAKGAALVLREGGVGQLARYVRNFAERRAQRRSKATEPDHASLDGDFLAGWHAPEPNGRWTCDFASFRVPPGAEALTLDVHAPAGRTITLWCGTTRVAGFATRPGHGDDRFEVDVESGRSPWWVLRVEPVDVTAEQKKYGDTRRLGAFVKSLRFRVAGGRGGSHASTWHEVDLSLPQAHHAVPVTLSRDRFELPLNGAILRHADAFVVHSQYVAERIRRERGEHVPVGIIHHGAEARFDDTRPRAEIRRALGLTGPWLTDFLVASFGGVQPHKRIDKLLDALVLARREQLGIRLVLAGKVSGDFFDAEAEIRRRHLTDAVKLTGYVPEELGWEWLRAADLSVNLRGPTSGGTSGGIFQSFGVGRAVIASDAAEQKELPSNCTVKVPLGDGEVKGIAAELVALASDAPRRAALESNVRAFVKSECHWGVVADRLLAHLRQFPARRGTRKPFAAAR